MEDGLKEQYKYKGLKIVFAVKKGIPYSTVLSGATVLKSCSNDSMEKVKDEVRDFLKNPKSIEHIITKNHAKFLREKGIENPEQIGIYKAESKRQLRSTHCYSCGHSLTSFVNYTCKKCNWLLCSCGACRCGYYKF